jgi:uncharacterized protein (UPF0335 family)
VEVQHDDYTKQMINSHQKINLLENSNLSLSQKLKDTERNLEQERYEVEDLKKQLVILTEGELATTKRSLDREYTTHSETRKLYTKAAEELKDAISKIEQLEQDNRRMNNQIRKLSEDLEGKEQKLLTANQKILSLENVSNHIYPANILIQYNRTKQNYRIR